VERMRQNTIGDSVNIKFCLQTNDLERRLSFVTARSLLNSSGWAFKKSSHLSTAVLNFHGPEQSLGAEQLAR
jgi:hypothetical protein